MKFDFANTFNRAAGVYKRRREAGLKINEIQKAAAVPLMLLYSGVDWANVRVIISLGTAQAA